MTRCQGKSQPEQSQPDTDRPLSAQPGKGRPGHRASQALTEPPRCLRARPRLPVGGAAPQGLSWSWELDFETVVAALNEPAPWNRPPRRPRSAVWSRAPPLRAVPPSRAVPPRAYLRSRAAPLRTIPLRTAPLRTLPLQTVLPRGVPPRRCRRTVLVMAGCAVSWWIRMRCWMRCWRLRCGRCRLRWRRGGWRSACRPGRAWRGGWRPRILGGWRMARWRGWRRRCGGWRRGRRRGSWRRSRRSRRGPRPRDPKVAVAADGRPGRIPAGAAAEVSLALVMSGCTRGVVAGPGGHAEVAAGRDRRGRWPPG